MVSIIIPVYNSSQYIERCICSVLAQTEQQIECLVVDDCGVDDSIEKCNNLFLNYSGSIVCRIIHHEQNKGVSAARNSGTDAATGKYIFYLDSDDEITPNCIEFLLKGANENPESEFIYGQCLVVNGKGLSEKLSYDITSLNTNYEVRKDFLFKKRKCYGVVWNKLVKRDFLVNNNIRFKEGIIHEDELWMYCVSMLANSIHFVDIPTYIHYSVENSIMNTLTSESDYINWCVILTDILSQMGGVCFKEQIVKYLYILLTHDCEQLRSSRLYRDLLCNFLEKAKICHMYKLTFALQSYLFFVKRGKGQGVYNWLFHYTDSNCNYKGSLIKVIFYDLIATYSINSHK